MMAPEFQLDDMTPRRPATLASLDARLSVWGQAARDATERRAEALVEGAVLYVERVGRNADVLRADATDPADAFLGEDYDSLVGLAAALLPTAVPQSCRLLWVDPDRLRERLLEALIPSLEAARAEVRRKQALYRRRARLWQHDEERMNRLRDELESLRVPRCRQEAVDVIGRGLLRRHQRTAPPQVETPRAAAVTGGGLSVQPGSLTRWIAQLDHKILEHRAVN